MNADLAIVQGLATCHHAAFKPDMGVSVRISLGRPRFGPDSTEVLRTLMPEGFKDDPYRSYRPKYEARLETFGLDAIAEQLQRIAEEHTARPVLLCFESLKKPGQWCHRRLFAEWWERHTGQQVPELGGGTVNVDIPAGVDPDEPTAPKSAAPAAPGPVSTTSIRRNIARMSGEQLALGLS